MRLYHIIILLTVLSCAKEQGVCLKGRGADSQKTIELQRYNKLEIHDKIDIEIYKGPNHKAIIYSGSNIIDGIELTVQNKTLSIQDNNTCHWLRSLKEKPKVKLYLDSLEFITFYGAGNLTSFDTIPSNTMHIEAWEGSGDLDFLTDSRELYLKSHTGVSHFKISGKSQYLYLYNNTYAQFSVEELISDKADVISIGNGDIKVFTEHKLSINQTGFSKIEYNESVLELNIIAQNNGELIPY